MLEIKNLHANVDGKTVLNGVSLTIPAGEVHAIMGPNGSGKSTLSYVLAGRPGYIVTEGDICLNGESILDWSVDRRARTGIFLAFQYPVEIPGVAGMSFLKNAVNSVRTHRGQKPYDSVDFLKLIRSQSAALKIDEKLLQRGVNTGFSGGEKKRYDILQMSLLEPIFAILDETDSGLDIDALKIVADGVNRMRDKTRSFLMITHYQRLLDYINPDVVHIFSDGRIKLSGGPELALELEKKGYAMLSAEVK
jgi:Fe-S cluster assembly ATP-binding protein